MSKETYKKVKCDCRDCQRAGPVRTLWLSVQNTDIRNP